jgi:flagellar biosynthesis/type III secretory pathway M-ring protein FliF/YscJ
MSLTSEATTTEPPPVGPVGATVNLPDEAEDQGRVVMNTTDTEEITNNEVGKRVETTEIPPGTEVEIVGVTCVVEGSYEETEEGERQYVAPTDEDLERYAQIVRNSVGGVDAALVTTSHQAFELDGLEETVTAFERTEFYRNLYKLIVNVGKVVLVLVLFLVARWLLLRMFAPAPEEEEEELVTEESAADRRRREMAEDISRASQEQPESVANLIRSWMSESEE